MAQIARVKAVWSGFTGAPGYTTFSFIGVNDATTATGATTAMRTFFQAIVSLLRTTTQITVQPIVEMHDEATGILQQDFVVTPAPIVVTGTASAATAWMGGTGATLTWKTNQIWNGKRVKGRTYLVPLVGVSDTDGTLTPGAITAIQGACDGLIASASADLAIWSRQFTTTTPITQTGGKGLAVGAAVVVDKTGILRSRRD